LAHMSLVVELSDVELEESLRYFVTLLILGGPMGEEPMQMRTDVSPTPTKSPSFKTRVFTFPVPDDAEKGQWSLQLNAVAAAPDGADADSGSKPKLRVVGAADLLLGELIAPLLLQRGEPEVSKTISLMEPAADEAGAASRSEKQVGTMAVKLRLEPGAGGSSDLSPQQRASMPAMAPAQERAWERELAHKQELVDRLMEDVAQKSAAAARAGEEVMELRGVNKRLESELTALRSHMDERERAMEQLAGDATNVENIDLPQLQSRHRMLGAAYRADRRRMQQLQAQVEQLSAALGTQEQLSASYAKLKDAHREQAQQMQRLQEEVKKMAKYRMTAKQQETIIQRLESLMAATLKDAKRAKVFQPQLNEAQKLRGELEAQLTEQHAKLAQQEAEARQREQELLTQLESRPEGDEGGASAEETAKLLMRAEKAERRAAALEEEMTEMARANGRESATLKMKLAEADAQLKGGFGSAANLVLGELPMPAALAPAALAPATDLPPLPPRLPSGGSSQRRSTPPGGRLEPVAAPAIAIAAQ